MTQRKNRLEWSRLQIPFKQATHQQHASIEFDGTTDQLTATGLPVTRQRANLLAIHLHDHRISSGMKAGDRR